MEAASPRIHWEALFQSFGKERPDAVRSIEEMAAAKKAKKQVQKSARDVARRMIDQRDDPTL